MTGMTTRGPARWRRLLLIAMTAVLGLGVGLAWAGQASSAGGSVRVMPLGDSITGGPGCWRALLWQKLQAAGYREVDMVGTVPGGGCSVASWDADGEGHGGFSVVNVAAQNQLVTWLAATHPDVVLMHFGTNDIWAAYPTAKILDAYSTLVEQMRAANPAMKIIVAQIIPMEPSNCAGCAARVKDLNAAIPAWAASKNTARSPITVVDQWTGFVASTDTTDGVHPNTSGDTKIANRWYPALAAALGTASAAPTATSTPTAPSVTSTPTAPSAPSTPSTTTSPTTTATASRTGVPTAPTSSSSPTTGIAAGGCRATYRLVHRWQGGFLGQVTVTNLGDLPLARWTASWTPARGENVIHVWNGVSTQSGGRISVANPTWGTPIGPGRTATIGFIGSALSPSTPTVTCTAR